MSDGDPAPRRHQSFRAGLFLSALFSLGASRCEEPPRYRQQAFLVNRTSERLDVSVAWARSGRFCDEPLSEVAAMPSSSFEGARSISLDTGDVAALNADPGPSVSPVGRCRNPEEPEAADAAPTGSCTVVIIRVSGGPSRVLRAPRSWAVSGWSNLHSRCDSKIDPIVDPGEGAVVLEGKPGNLRITAYPRVELAPYP